MQTLNTVIIMAYIPLSNDVETGCNEYYNHGIMNNCISSAITMVMKFFEWNHNVSDYNVSMVEAGLNAREMGSLIEKLMECEVVHSNGGHASAAIETGDLWHQRLGHLNRQQLNTMIQQKLATGIRCSPTSDLSFCEGCIAGKMQWKPFKSVNYNQSNGKLEFSLRYHWS